MAGIESPGAVSNEAASIERALTHPAVVRLASLLKIDLNNDEERKAVVALVETNMKAAKAGVQPAEPERNAASIPAPVRPITPYYVSGVIKAYNEVAGL